MPPSHQTPETRFRALSPAEQALWLDPAEAEFCQHGFARASMNRILAHAGQSKGRSYHYFSDKAALYRATLLRAFTRVEGLDDTPVLQAQDAQEFWARAVALAAALAAALQRDAALDALLRGLFGETAAQNAMAEPLQDLRARVAAMIVAGQYKGAVRRDLPVPLLCEVTLGLARILDRWFADAAPSLPPDSAAEQSQRAFGLLIAPLLPPDLA
ncbi:MAG: TetR/AcrR family transcriptional regulator [Rhodobacteraceae bacterium]|jgi:AcrR family transcriptional regulator|nr:TetR/AcrR family transcriptional regulator [Paracoccaceae bacterium]